MIDITDFKEKTLFIIGNGFDIAHDIKSSYKDFRDWLASSQYQDFISYLEEMFPLKNKNTPLLWKDFETAIGIYNPEEIHYRFFQGKDYGLYDENVQLRVVNRIKPFIDMIPVVMRDWAKDITYFNTSPVFRGLTPDSKYLSFNYTLVLEDCYHIPSQNICHIHGNIKDNRVVVGHNQRRFMQSEYKNQNNVEGSKSHIVELMNKNVKPVTDLINNNFYFFNSLNDIQKVFVYGHSLAQIDMPYFEEVASKVLPNCVWYFCCHNQEDENRVREIAYLPTFQGFSIHTHIFY